MNAKLFLQLVNEDRFGYHIFNSAVGLINGLYITNKTKWLLMFTTYNQLLQLLTDDDESKMQLAAEVVSQSPIIVVDTKVGWAHLTHPQLLLLVAGRRHWVAILNLYNIHLGVVKPQLERLHYKLYYHLNLTFLLRQNQLNCVRIKY